MGGGGAFSLKDFPIEKAKMKMAELISLKVFQPSVKTGICYK